MTHEKTTIETQDTSFSNTPAPHTEKVRRFYGLVEYKPFSAWQMKDKIACLCFFLLFASMPAMSLAGWRDAQGAPLPLLFLYFSSEIICMMFFMDQFISLLEKLPHPYLTLLATICISFALAMATASGMPLFTSC